MSTTIDLDAIRIDVYHAFGAEVAERVIEIIASRHIAPIPQPQRFTHAVAEIIARRVLHPNEVYLDGPYRSRSEQDRCEHAAIDIARHVGAAPATAQRFTAEERALIVSLCDEAQDCADTWDADYWRVSIRNLCDRVRAMLDAAPAPAHTVNVEAGRKAKIRLLDLLTSGQVEILGEDDMVAIFGKVGELHLTGEETDGN